VPPISATRPNRRPSDFNRTFVPTVLPGRVLTGLVSAHGPTHVTWEAFVERWVLLPLASR
jgi:hypothetical protein